MNEHEYRELLKAAPSGLVHMAKLWEFFLDSHRRVEMVYKNRTELVQNIQDTTVRFEDALNLYDVLLIQCLQEFGYMGNALKEFRENEIIRLEAEKKQLEEYKKQMEEFSSAFKLALEIIRKAQSNESN